MSNLTGKQAPPQTMGVIAEAWRPVPNQSAPFAADAVGYFSADMTKVGPERFEPVQVTTDMGGATGAELIDS